MDQARKDLLIRVSYLMNALLFFMGGFVLIEDERVLFAIIQFIASSLNLLGFLFALDRRVAFRFKQSVLLVDILVAMSVAVNYAQEGRQYIQYAWAVAAVFTLVALIVLSRKEATRGQRLQE